MTSRYGHSLALRCLSAAFLVLVLHGCKKKVDAADTETADEASAVSVQAEKVVSGSITESIESDSVLAPLTQASIVPKVSAPVKRFFVQRGTRVHAGQVLAVLENADLAAGVVDARGGVEQARAAYSTAKNATVPEDRATAQAIVEQAKSALDVQKTQTASRAKLFQEGAIPKRDYDTAQAALVQAQGAFSTASQHLAGLNRASSAATIQNAAGGLESATGKFESAGAQLGFATIRSPLSGVVTDRPLFAGEMAQTGSPLITVMDVSFVLAKVHLPHEQALKLKIGNKAKVQLQNSTVVRDGAVSLISPATDTGTTTVEVWVKVPNPDNMLIPGSPVHVTMDERTLTQVTTVPNDSIVKTKSGRTAIMIVGSDSTTHVRQVDLGATDGKNTQVLRGASVGETVVTTGSQSLEDGTKVKFAAAESEQPDGPDKSGSGSNVTGKSAPDVDGSVNSSNAPVLNHGSSGTQQVSASPRRSSVGNSHSAASVASSGNGSSSSAGGSNK